MLAKAVASESNAYFISVDVADLCRSDVSSPQDLLSSQHFQVRGIGKTTSEYISNGIHTSSLHPLFWWNSSGVPRTWWCRSFRTEGYFSQFLCWLKQMVSQLFLEMDKLQFRNGIYVIAASNNPEVLDQSFFRAGKSLFLFSFTYFRREVWSLAFCASSGRRRKKKNFTNASDQNSPQAAGLGTY